MWKESFNAPGKQSITKKDRRALDRLYRIIVREVIAASSRPFNKKKLQTVPAHFGSYGCQGSHGRIFKAHQQNNPKNASMGGTA